MSVGTTYYNIDEMLTLKYALLVYVLITLSDNFSAEKSDQR